MIISRIFKKINNKYVSLFVSLLSGAIGTLAFFPYNIWPCGILSIISLLKITLNNTWLKIISYSICWSFGFFGSGLYWIYFSIIQFSDMCNLINVLLIIIIIFYLSLFPTLFSIITFIVWPGISIWRLTIFSPILWFFIECLRSNLFTGFPWLQFGYTQIDGPLQGLAPIFGIEGITFFLIGISGLITYAIIKKNFFFNWKY